MYKYVFANVQDCANVPEHRAADTFIVVRRAAAAHTEALVRVVAYVHVREK